MNHLAVRKCTKDNNTLKDIIIEVGKMSENKEARTMQLDRDTQIEILRQVDLLGEKYAEADLNAMKSYALRTGRKEGRKEGEDILADTVVRLRNGESSEQIVASGISQHTVDLAMTIQ